MSCVFDRVRIRIPQEEASDDLLYELITIISDRLTMRLGAEELPVAMRSIAVDATVKMFRRVYYEGIASESIASISTSFVEDILAEYAEEIDAYRAKVADTDGTGKVVHFL